jgi:hypothetical protein
VEDAGWRQIARGDCRHSFPTHPPLSAATTKHLFPVPSDALDERCNRPRVRRPGVRHTCGPGPNISTWKIRYRSPMITVSRVCMRRRMSAAVEIPVSVGHAALHASASPDPRPTQIKARWMPGTSKSSCTPPRCTHLDDDHTSPIRAPHRSAASAAFDRQRHTPHASCFGTGRTTIAIRTL